MNKKMIAGVAIAAVAMLALMGLAFCWLCPDFWVCRAEKLGAHWAFWRQLAWNAVGVLAFVLAWKVGWPWWMKAAPFVVAGSVCIMFATVHYGACISGCHMLRLGPVDLEVMNCLPLVGALFLAWLQRMMKWRTRTLILMLGGAFLAAMATQVMTNANRMARIMQALNDDAALPANSAALYVSQQMKAAFAETHWFTGGNSEVLRNLPGALTHAMPCAASVVFGKWFLLVACLAFAAIASVFAYGWHAVGDRSKKTFILFAGLGIIMPAVMGVCECLALLPVRFTCVPLVAFGWTKVLLTWLTAGVFVSLLSEKDATPLVA